MSHLMQIVSGTMCAYTAYLNLRDNNWDFTDDNRRGNFGSAFELILKKILFLSEISIDPVIFI